MRTRCITQVLSFHILAHSFALFCTSQKLNPFLFNRFRTLCQKTPGVGIPAPLMPLLPCSSANLTLHAFSRCLRTRRSRPELLGDSVGAAWASLPVLPFNPQLSTLNCRLFTYNSRLASPGGVMSFSQRFDEIRTGFERPFWVANITELFERLSYYAVFASLARYLHEVLSFPTERATNLTGLFGGLVWFLAIFGGAIADRLGFRRALKMARN